MIKSFKHKGIEDFFLNDATKGIQSKNANRLADILDLLDAANEINVMNFPGSGLHKLEPKKDNIWSVKVSGNWRVTFKFYDGDAYFVNYIDYH
jgi:proteic killer suppression protein